MRVVFYRLSFWWRFRRIFWRLIFTWWGHCGVLFPRFCRWFFWQLFQQYPYQYRWPVLFPFICPIRGLWIWVVQSVVQSCISGFRSFIFLPLLNNSILVFSLVLAICSTSTFEEGINPISCLCHFYYTHWLTCRGLSWLSWLRNSSTLSCWHLVFSSISISHPPLLSLHSGLKLSSHNSHFVLH